MTTCDICGFHIENTNKPCPNCEKLKQQGNMPSKNYTQEELSRMPICDTCGNHYENNADNQKICPHCREIRMQSSVSRQPGGKTAAELEAERKRKQYETTVDQVVIEDKDKFKRLIPVFVSIGAVIIAVIAAVVMN